MSKEKLHCQNGCDFPDCTLPNCVTRDARHYSMASDFEKTTIINGFVVECSKHLLALMHIFGIKNYVTASVIDTRDGSRFNFSFKKEDGDRLYSAAEIDFAIKEAYEIGYNDMCGWLYIDKVREKVRASIDKAKAEGSLT